MRKLNYLFDVPDTKKIRMIIHTDCKNEADDQFALVHHLMTPKFIVRGIIAGHFNLNPQCYGEGNTAKASYNEICKVLKLMDMEEICPVKKGAEYPLKNEHSPIGSEGAELIIEEAMKEDKHPLYIVCQGGLTDLATAIIMKPEICNRMTAIWVGGGAYPMGGFEFNCKSDIVAANILMRSKMPLWQIPINVYKQISLSLAEIQLNVASCGKIGEYLFKQMKEFNEHCAEIVHWPHGEIWGLGDSAAIGVLMEESEKTDIYEWIDAPEIDYDSMEYKFDNLHRKIRVYKTINTRLVLGDFFAKLKINYGGEEVER